MGRFNHIFNILDDDLIEYRKFNLKRHTDFTSFKKHLLYKYL